MSAARRFGLPCALLLAAGYGCGTDEPSVDPTPVEPNASGSSRSSGAGEGGNGDPGSAAGAGGQTPLESAGGSGAACAPGAVAAGLGARAQGLALHRVAVLQAVSIPIMEQLIELTERKAEVLTARPTLFRASVKPAANFRPRSVLGRLTLVNGEQEQVFEQTRLVAGASSDAELDSTFNFEVPAEALQPGVRYSLELFETETCREDQGDSSAARFPEDGALSLRAEAAHVLKVHLVPVAVAQGATTLLPDTSAEQLELFRQSLVKVFPIADVELSVRKHPVNTSAGDMLTLLDEVAALRDEENTDPNVSYYGLVRFEEQEKDYCSPSCVLGASFTGETPSGGVGVGIGYTGEKAARTFVHELGHVYGRPHSPCGVAGDPAFPYSGGRIGSWGYDVFDGKLYDPLKTMDFMGYCSPNWVSDHTYELLRAFIALMGQKRALFQASNQRLSRYRTLIVGDARAPRWGRSRSMRAKPAGRRELATVYDAAGSTMANLEVFRQRSSEGDVEAIYVPEPIDTRWVRLQTDGRTSHLVPRRMP